MKPAWQEKSVLQGELETTLGGKGDAWRELADARAQVDRRNAETEKLRDPLAQFNAGWTPRAAPEDSMDSPLQTRRGFELRS